MKLAKQLLTASSLALLAGCVSTPVVQEYQSTETGRWHVTSNGQAKITLHEGGSYVYADFQCRSRELPRSVVAFRHVQPGPDSNKLANDDRVFIREMVEGYESGRFRRQIYVDGKAFEDGMQKTSTYDPDTSTFNYVSFYWANSELIEAMRRGSEMKLVYTLGTAKGKIEEVVPLAGSSVAMDEVDCG